MWIAVTLISLALLIILVLCVPIDVAFYICTHTSHKFRIRLIWLFGLVDKELEKGKEKTEKKIIKDKQRHRGGISASTIFQILKTKGLITQLKQLVVDIFNCFKIKRLGADLVIGLDNPADTGLLFAIAGPVNNFLSSYFHYDISLQPSFDNEATLKGDLHGVIRSWPIRFIRPITRFIFSLPAFRVVKTLVATKWKRKQ